MSSADLGACRTWIYPTNMTIRPYQVQICQEVLYNNTLVCLPTGLGKTLIAAVVMYNYYRFFPNGKIVFMAPTKPLITQQIVACHDIMGIPESDTAVLEGSVSAKQREVFWQKRRIFYCTPQVLLNDLKHGIVSPSIFVLLVFDEAHRATGNYAYTVAMQEMIASEAKFRVLALSATPGGDVKAIQKVIHNLKITHIEVRSEEDPDVEEFTHLKQIEILKCPMTSNQAGTACQQNEARFKSQILDLMSTAAKYLYNRKIILNNNVQFVSPFILEDAKRSMTYKYNGLDEAELQQMKMDLQALDVLLFLRRDCYKLVEGHQYAKLYQMLSNLCAESSSPHSDRSRYFSEQEFPSVSHLDGNVMFRGMSQCFKYRQLMFLAKDTMGVDLPLANGAATNAKLSPAALAMKTAKIPMLKKVLVEHFRRRGPGDPCTIAGPEASKSNSRVIVFVQLRNTVTDVVAELATLANEGIVSHEFVGQAGSASSNSSAYDNDEEVTDETEQFNRFIARRKMQKMQLALQQQQHPVGGNTKSSNTSLGLNQQEQSAVLSMFRRGTINVLVATCIAEEGLDIGDVDLIIMLDTVASPTRLVQRMGRTGRKRPGRVVMLTVPGRDDEKIEKNSNSSTLILDALRKPRSHFVLFKGGYRMIPVGIDPVIDHQNINVSDIRLSQVGGSRLGGYGDADGTSSNRRVNKDVTKQHEPRDNTNSKGIMSLFHNDVPFTRSPISCCASAGDERKDKGNQLSSTNARYPEIVCIDDDSFDDGDMRCNLVSSSAAVISAPTEATVDENLKQHCVICGALCANGVTCVECMSVLNESAKDTASHPPMDQDGVAPSCSSTMYGEHMAMQRGNREDKKRNSEPTALPSNTPSSQSLFESHYFHADDGTSSYVCQFGSQESNGHSTMMAVPTFSVNLPNNTPLEAPSEHSASVVRQSTGGESPSIDDSWQYKRCFPSKPEPLMRSNSARGTNMVVNAPASTININVCGQHLASPFASSLFDSIGATKFDSASLSSRNFLSTLIDDSDEDNSGDSCVEENKPTAVPEREEREVQCASGMMKRTGIQQRQQDCTPVNIRRKRPLKKLAVEVTPPSSHSTRPQQKVCVEQGNVVTVGQSPFRNNFSAFNSQQALSSCESLAGAPSTRSGGLCSSKSNLSFSYHNGQCLTKTSVSICDQEHAGARSDGDDDEKEDGEDDICCVCLSPNGEDDNPIIYCDGGCNMCVHSKCFGLNLDEIPKDSFYCDGCCPFAKYGSSRTPRCKLCKIPGGLLKKTSCGQHYVHLVCVMFTSELTTDERNRPNNIQDMNVDRRELFCRICKGRGGACVQCAHPACLVSAHPYCSLVSGGQLVIRTGSSKCLTSGFVDDNTVHREFYCRKHAQWLNSSELNGQRSHIISSTQGLDYSHGSIKHRRSSSSKEDSGGKISNDSRASSVGDGVVSTAYGNSFEDFEDTAFDPIALPSHASSRASPLPSCVYLPAEKENEQNISLNDTPSFLYKRSSNGLRRLKRAGEGQRHIGSRAEASIHKHRKDKLRKVIAKNNKKLAHLLVEREADVSGSDNSPDDECSSDEGEQLSGSFIDDRSQLSLDSNDHSSDGVEQAPADGLEMYFALHNQLMESQSPQTKSQVLLHCGNRRNIAKVKRNRRGAAPEADYYECGEGDRNGGTIGDVGSGNVRGSRVVKERNKPKPLHGGFLHLSSDDSDSSTTDGGSAMCGSTAGGGGYVSS